MALRIEPQLNVFVVDTELLFPETYALMERVERRYGIRIERVRPAAERRRAERRRTATRCGCATRMRAAICARWNRCSGTCSGFDAWLTAIRRDQSDTRSRDPGASLGRAAQILKVAPLADWTEADVWAYVQAHDVPVNTLHFDGLSEHRLRALHAPRRARRTRAGRSLGRV